MAVLIKGMEMPKAQFQKSSTLYHVEGTIFVYPDGKARAELSVDYNERKSYPIIPVPELHGRLIDADLLTGRIEHDTPLSSTFEKIVRRYIENAPTVIPESESKERPAFLPTYELTPRKTNADRIRRMSDKELAEFISSQIIDRNIGVPIEAWLDWLRKEG